MLLPQEALRITKDSSLAAFSQFTVPCHLLTSAIFIDTLLCEKYHVEMKYSSRLGYLVAGGVYEIIGLVQTEAERHAK